MTLDARTPDQRRHDLQRILDIAPARDEQLIWFTGLMLLAFVALCAGIGYCELRDGMRAVHADIQEIKPCRP